MALYKQYQEVVSQIKIYDTKKKDHDSFITNLFSMAKDYSYSTGQLLDTILPEQKQISAYLEQYKLLLKGYSFREFSLCALVNSEKKIYLCQRKNKPGMDYPGLWQVAGGGVESSDHIDEDYFLACAKREVFEETGLSVDNLQLVSIVEGSRIFPGKEEEECYRTTLYFVDINDLEPSNTEPEKHHDWQLKSYQEIRDLKDFASLTDTLSSELEEMLEKIDSFFKIKRKKKKRKIVVNSIGSTPETNE